VADQLAIDHRLALAADLGLDQLAQRLRDRPGKRVVERRDPRVGRRGVGVAVGLVRNDIFGARWTRHRERTGQHGHDDECLHLALSLANRDRRCRFSAHFRAGARREGRSMPRRDDYMERRRGAGGRGVDRTTAR